MDKKSLLIILFVNDNHISNVKSLQSIMAQTYENIYLAICNDCVVGFQEERFITNLWNRKGGIQQIRLYDNETIKGEKGSVKRILSDAWEDFVLIVNSGERIISNTTILDCMNIIESRSSVKMMCFAIERQSAGSTDVLKYKEACEKKMNGIAIYSREFLKNYIEINQDKVSSICEITTDSQYEMFEQSYPICIFTECEMCNKYGNNQRSYYEKKFIQIL